MSNEDLRECELAERHLKWSWSKAIIGIWKTWTSKEHWVFLIFTLLFFAEESADIEHWIVYGSVCAVYIFSVPLSSLISRGNLNVNANAGISKTISESKDGKV